MSFLASTQESSQSNQQKPPNLNYDFQTVLASTWSALGQTPPPSLREILGAYNARGDGDRDMLLAMLNAKSAEDERLASVAALHKTMLEMHLPSSPYSRAQLQVHERHSSSSHYMSSSSPHVLEQKQSRSSRRSSSRSPTRTLPSMRDAPPSQGRRKRPRSSRSPATYARSDATVNQAELPPPSPPSSHDSVEYSPRSRASMSIGSLLSFGPSKEANGDDGSLGRDRSRDRSLSNHLPPSAV